MLLIVGLLSAQLLAAPPQPGIYERLRTVQKCRSQKDNPNQMDCDFDPGVVHFEIAGVGAPDAGVAIYKADFDSELHLSYGVAHGCFIITSNKRLDDYAFVSPKTGGVYRDWRSCQMADPKKVRP